MKLFGKNLSKDFVVIAEAGVNHEGSLTKAKKLIKMAKEAGADAVKFQSYTPEKYVSKNDEIRFNRVKKFHFNKKHFLDLKNYATKIKLPIFSTAVTEDWVSFLAKNFGIIKIASGDINFFPTLDLALQTKKILIISLGGSIHKEVEYLIKYIKEKNGIKYLNEKIIFLHCVAAYPVPIEEANIKNLNYLKKIHKGYFGYSNHVIGNEACLASVALGAKVIEIHFTDKKVGRKFRDHQLSFTPVELKSFINIAKRLHLSLGTEIKKRTKSEASNLHLMRKGIVALKDLKKNELITDKCIGYARPADANYLNIPAHLIKKKMLGKKMKCDVKKSYNLKISDIKE